MAVVFVDVVIDRIESERCGEHERERGAARAGGSVVELVAAERSVPALGAATIAAVLLFIRAASRTCPGRELPRG